MVGSPEELSCLSGPAGKGWRLSCLGYPTELGCPARGSAVSAVVSKAASAAPTLQFSPQSSGDCLQPLPTETKERDERSGVANQRCAGAASLQSLGQDDNACQRGGTCLEGAAADWCGSGRGVKCSSDSRTWPIYISLVSLQLPLSSLLLIAFYLGSLAAALQPDALNTRWDRKQVNNESSSPLYRGEGGSIC